MRMKNEYDKIIVRKNRNENKNSPDFYFYVAVAVGQAVPDVNAARLAMSYCRSPSGTA